MTGREYWCVDCDRRESVPAGDDPDRSGVQRSGWYTCRLWQTCPSCCRDLADAMSHDRMSADERYLSRRWSR